MTVYPSHQGLSPKQSRNFVIKGGLKTESVEGENDYYRQLAHDETSLRLESLTKQYELKLSKQEEFYQLRELKLKDEVQNMQLQISVLENDLFKAKSSSKQDQGHCSTCSNGTIITHLNKIIAQLQESHNGCLENKKELTHRAERSEARVIVLEEENEQLYSEAKKANRELRQMWANAENQ